MVGLCRLCASLRKIDILTTIKDDNSVICEKLRKCCQLNITIKDGLPKSICPECIENLDMSHKFYEKVREAQETLQALYPSINYIEAREMQDPLLVKNLSRAGEKRTKVAYEDVKIKSKQGEEKGIVASQPQFRFKGIKFENDHNSRRLYSGKETKSFDSRKETEVPESIQSKKSLNCLEEVFHMLEMTKEEVFENTYEILETIEEKVPEEINTEEQGCVNYEKVCYQEEQVIDEQKQVLGDCNENNLSNQSNGKMSTLLCETQETELIFLDNDKELNIEMEYMEDEEDENDVIPDANVEGNKEQIEINLSLQLKSWKHYTYLCFVCDHKLLTFSELKHHIALKHNIAEIDKLQYKCYDCQKIIPRYNFFLNHVRAKHHPSLKLKCDVCDLSCQNFEELSNHRSDNCTESKNYSQILPCKQCFKSFHNTYGLQYHSRLQHSRPKVNVKFQCLQCNKHFQYKSCLKVHERLHTDRKKFACSLCESKFFNKLSLEQHLYAHIADKLYKCHICSKSFKSYLTLDQHQIIHSDEKPFKCQYCDKRFRKKIELSNHERTHTGETPFQCEQCDKRFRFRSAYNAHLKCHSGVKPYACEYCDKTFADSSNRNKHVRRKHPSGEKDENI